MLAAEGRGFCAGVDIKEMQRTPGHERADPREPGLLRRLRGGLRLRGAGGRRRARVSAWAAGSDSPATPTW